MPKISEMTAPGTITGLEMVPGLQADTNVGVPLLALGSVPRGNVLQLRKPFVVDLSATADADPGAGKVRWNNAAPAAATIVYIDNAASDASDISSTWAALDVGGYFYVQGAADGPHRANWQKWQVTSITAASGYAKLGVTLQASAGAFADTDAVEVTLQQPTPTPGIDRNTVNVASISGGVVTIDCSLGDYFTLAPTADITGWTLSNVPPACSLMIDITQDATARTIAWPASFKWAGGAAGSVSTAAGAKDLLAITTFDGGATWRVTLGKAYA